MVPLWQKIDNKHLGQVDAPNFHFNLFTVILSTDGLPVRQLIEHKKVDRNPGFIQEIWPLIGQKLWNGTMVTNWRHNLQEGTN